MKLFVFMNKDNEMLCRKGNNNKVMYTSKTEVDRMLTYRRYAQALSTKKDKHYFLYRNIDISDFCIVLIDINITVIMENKKDLLNE